MKKPDEIKKGLLFCGDVGHGCAGCPYDNDCRNQGDGESPEMDAIEYINRLESRLAQSEREREEAVSLIGKLIVILKKYPNAATNMCAYEAYMEIKKYLLDMRGVCEENTKDDADA